jgi:hypothetical protein
MARRNRLDMEMRMTHYGSSNMAIAMVMEEKTHTNNWTRR